MSLFVSRVARVLSRSGERVGMSGLRKWLASAVAAGLLVGGMSGGLALAAGQSEAEKNHEQAMKHEEAMKKQEAASHDAAMRAAELTG